MFDRILIANRGEIAVRILRACRELGIQTVAIYSEADRRSLHVRLADQAVLVGPAPASESYLKIPAILEAAAQTGCQAIHPGYGFLSENADFARAVQQAGLAFIGPPPEAIATMGDKAAARRRMQAAGVPVAPGYDGPDDPDSLFRAAAETGYPLLVKAAAGGGGKGMRLVRQPEELAEAIGAARSEARRAFANDHLLLERYVPRARHIEFQVLADTHGAVLHLFERDCSVQRRHQKIVEETPSPLLDGALRREMGAAAVAAARAAGYTNAGTVEFIFDPSTRSYYFLEMNTRLQVEHPVTELVTGLDLVQWQIRIAAGERLPFDQESLRQTGHAIECRLYAEDPSNNFLPASGSLLRFIPPQGPGIRVETGVAGGDEITIHYDPLIAKLVVHAADRPAAIRRMQSALRDTVTLGLTTNARFLQDLLADPGFLAGEAHTTWVEETFQDWQPPDCDPPPEIFAAAALTTFARPATPAPPAGNDPYSPWRAGSGFRLGESTSPAGHSGAPYKEV